MPPYYSITDASITLTGALRDRVVTYAGGGGFPIFARTNSFESRKES